MLILLHTHISWVQEPLSVSKISAWDLFVGSRPALSFSWLFSVLALLQFSGAQLKEAEQITMDSLQAQCGLFNGLPYDEKGLHNWKCYVREIWRFMQTWAFFEAFPINLPFLVSWEFLVALCRAAVYDHEYKGFKVKGQSAAKVLKSRADSLAEPCIRWVTAQPQGRMPSIIHSKSPSLIPMLWLPLSHL